MTCVEQERCIQCTVGPFGPYVTPANWPAYLLDLCLLFFRILLCLLGQPLQLLGSELWSTEKKCEYINKYPTLSYLLSDIGLRFSLEHTFNWKSVSVKRWWETESDIWSVYNINCHTDYMDKRAGHLTTHYIYRSCLPLNPIPCSSQNSLCANVNARGTLEIVI